MLGAGSGVIARHISPDGEVTLVIERVEEAAGPMVVMGFEEGGGWHIHPTEEEALRIAAETLADRVVIMAWKAEGRGDIELMDELELELGLGGDGVQYSFRLWSQKISFEDLASGMVKYTPLSGLWNWRAS